VTSISSTEAGSSSTAPPIARPARNITIIVVDDDPLTRAELGRALQREGYSITEATTSMDCLKLLDAGATFDLLITKVSMAPPHGFALGRMAKHRNPPQKVLYLGGAQTSLSDNEREVMNGPVLDQPTDVAELLGAVKQVLASEEA
jgi:two-component system, cell cycle sensor histidine kinase and response regulator CckA